MLKRMLYCPGNGQELSPTLGVTLVYIFYSAELALQLTLYSLIVT